VDIFEGSIHRCVILGEQPVRIKVMGELVKFLAHIFALLRSYLGGLRENS